MLRSSEHPGWCLQRRCCCHRCHCCCRCWWMWWQARAVLLSQPQQAAPAAAAAALPPAAVAPSSVSESLAALPAGALLVQNAWSSAAGERWAVRVATAKKPRFTRLPFAAALRRQPWRQPAADALRWPAARASPAAVKAPEPMESGVRQQWRRRFGWQRCCCWPLRQ